MIHGRKPCWISGIGAAAGGWGREWRSCADGLKSFVYLPDVLFREGEKYIIDSDSTWLF
jgi:hypothetical protein